jgi:hypothetical protein
MRRIRFVGVAWWKARRGSETSDKRQERKRRSEKNGLRWIETRDQRPEVRWDSIPWFFHTRPL